MATTIKSAAMSDAERDARQQLAACYRIFAHLGWDELIYNHISLRVPGEEDAFLINPFSLMYEEVTASNLVKIDIEGNKLADSPWPVNRAGFVQHSLFHRHLPDAHCIIHTHDPYCLAVACKEGGLSMDNFYAAFLHGRVAYHDFEGVAVHEDEQPRLVASLGGKPCLLLRNHGVLVAEHDVASAFYWYYVLRRACQTQVMSSAMPGANIPLTAAAREVSSRGVQDTDPQRDIFPKMFAAAVRRAGLTLDTLL